MANTSRWAWRSLQGRGALPLCTEAEHLVQLDRAELPGEGAEHAACFDRAELVEVAGGDHVRVGAAGRGEDQGQVGGGQHGRLVQDQDVTGAELDRIAELGGAFDLAEERR